MKKQTLNEEISRIKDIMGKISEQVFNDAGEPMMTHSQYRDYSEPSEPDNDDNFYDDEPMDDNSYKRLHNEFKKHDIFIGGFDDDYYVASGNDNEINIQYDGHNWILNAYNDKTKEDIREVFSFMHEVVEYVVNLKDRFDFKSYEEAVNIENKSFRDYAGTVRGERQFGA